MTLITEEMRTAFREQGFVVVPDVLTEEQVVAGRTAVAALLAEQPPAEGHVGPYSLWPTFDDDDHSLLDFYRYTRIGDLAAELLRPGLGVDEPDFAQVASTVPPWPNRPGGPHVDGITQCEADGRPGTFSMLAGVWLSDQTRPHTGNLWIWPGTHVRFGQYLAERGADAITNLKEMNPGPYPKVDLGTPIQATGPAGSVLFAHYLLAHNIGNHDGDADAERRQTVYYRLHATGHRNRWRQALTDPLAEFRSP